MVEKQGSEGENRNSHGGRHAFGCHLKNSTQVLKLHEGRSTGTLKNGIFWLRLRQTQYMNPSGSVIK